ncbi:MAG: enoyl-CoA hydratase/isomerase family protein [Actinomycetota bacterium]
MVVDLRVDGRVAHLTLARPGARNTIDLTLARELHEATTEISEDDSVGAVILSGQGDTFCMGGDLRSFASVDDLPAHLREVTHHLHAALDSLARMAPPVIAAVRGFAAGAGLGLACAADIVLAGTSARFLSAYTNVGLTPDGSTSWSLPRLVGMRRALELVLTNRVLDANEAAQWGIATRVVADEALDEEALALATTLADGATSALGGAKRLVRGSFARTLEVQLQLETEILAAAAATNQGREGVVAFIEKRPPKFNEKFNKGSNS